MYIFFKIVTVKPPIVSLDKRDQRYWRLLSYKEKNMNTLVTTFLPRTSLQIGGIQSIHCFITQNIPFYQGRLYKSLDSNISTLQNTIDNKQKSVYTIAC